ncbi:MAG: hypothetical protein AAB309_06695, partial [Deltaproteobacteria bacterium]
PPAQPTGEFTEGTIRTFFGAGSPAVIANPGALVIDASDNLFVSGFRQIPDPTAPLGFRGEAGVFKITPAKEISLVTRITGITALAFDSQGSLFVLEERFPDQFQSQNISVLHKILIPGGTQTTVASNLTHPRGLLVIGGRIIVSESEFANDVVELPSSSGGAFKLIAGKTNQPGFSGDGGPAVEAQLDRPEALAIDSLGKIFICDVGNRRVRVIDTNGIINTAIAFSFVSSNDIPTVIFANANLRIPLITVEVAKVLDLEGNVIAGTGISGFSGDGGPAVNAQLNDPRGLAMDSKGFLYIADRGNNRIRIVNPKRGAGTPFIQ